MKNKLWPEVRLFRERFGYLPEFPPAEGAEDDEEETKPRPENTIRYWQDKLQETEEQLSTAKKNAQKLSDKVAQLNEDLVELQRMLETVENENMETRKALKEHSSLKEQLEEKIRTLMAELEDKETLIDQGETV